MTDRSPSDAELDALLHEALPPLPADPGAIDRVLARLGEGPELGATLPNDHESARLRAVVEEELLNPAEALVLEDLWRQLGEGMPELPADPAAIERCLTAVRASSGASAEPAPAETTIALGSSSSSAPRRLGFKLGLTLVLALGLGFTLALRPWEDSAAPPKPPVKESGEERLEAPVVVELPEPPEVKDPTPPKPPKEPPSREVEPFAPPSAPPSPEGPIVAERPTEPAIPEPTPPSRALSERERMLAMVKAEGFDEKDLELILNLDLVESLDRTRDDVLFSLSVDYEALEDLTEEDLDELSGGR